MPVQGMLMHAGVAKIFFSCGGCDKDQVSVPLAVRLNNRYFLGYTCFSGMLGNG